MKTAIVIGGSGMLAGLSRKLCTEFDAVGVVGRTAAKMIELQSFSGKIKGIMADYSDTDSLHAALQRFTTIYGKPDTSAGQRSIADSRTVLCS